MSVWCHLCHQVWQHFVSETDDKKWTQGKRKAESDPLVATAFLTTVQVGQLATSNYQQTNKSAIDEINWL